MRFVRKLGSLLALLAMISLMTVSVGCNGGEAKPKDSAKKPPASKAPEGGSSTGGGTATP